MSSKRLPRVVLDSSKESQEAETLLNRYGVQCNIERVVNQEDRHPEINVPHVFSKDGEFSGLGGVKTYIELVCDLDLPL